MAQFSPQSSEGFYLPESDIYDSQFIQDVDINSPEFKDYLVRLQQTLNNYARYINAKSNGSYETNEQVATQRYFSIVKGQSSDTLREVYRTVVNTGTLPNSGTKAVPHGIDFTNDTPLALHIYGAATITASKLSLPLPYSSPTLNSSIALTFNSTTVNITTAVDYSAYNHSYVVLEYLRVNI